MLSLCFRDQRTTLKRKLDLDLDAVWWCVGMVRWQWCSGWASPCSSCCLSASSSHSTSWLVWRYTILASRDVSPSLVTRPCRDSRVVVSSTCWVGQGHYDVIIFLLNIVCRLLHAKIQHQQYIFGLFGITLTLVASLLASPCRWCYCCYGDRGLKVEPEQFLLCVTLKADSSIATALQVLHTHSCSVCVDGQSNLIAVFATSAWRLCNL